VVVIKPLLIALTIFLGALRYQKTTTTDTIFSIHDFGYKHTSSVNIIAKRPTPSSSSLLPSNVSSLAPTGEEESPPITTPPSLEPLSNSPLMLPSPTPTSQSSEQHQPSMSLPAIENHKWTHVQTTNHLNQSAVIWINTQNPHQVYRDCGPIGRRNQIIYNFSNLAGLGDRQVILTAFCNLGAYLCANVYLSSPATALNVQRHDKDGGPLDPNLHWDDFWEVHPHMAPPEVKKSEDPNYASQLVYDIESATAESTTTDPMGVQQTFQKLSSPRHYRDELVKAMRIASDPVHELPFQWYITRNLYKQLPEIRAYFLELERKSPQQELYLPLVPDTSYSYVNLVLGQKVRNILDDLGQQLLSEFQYKEENAEGVALISWHIRRGDSKSECDTSLQRLKKYVNCTFAAVAGTDREIVVLINSDETDENYRSDVRSLFDPWKNIRAVNFDSWMHNKMYSSGNERWPVSYQNNFHLFLLEVAMIYSLPFAYHLEHHRTFDCKDCFQNLIL
jgi:hypothetical protein